MCSPLIVEEWHSVNHDPQEQTGCERCEAMGHEVVSPTLITQCPSQTEGDSTEGREVKEKYVIPGEVVE